MTSHEDVFSYFKEEGLAHGGRAVQSITVYGSSLTEEFRPGVSDYNFLVVADPIDRQLLDAFADRMGKWRKKRISAPLLLTPAFLEGALDAYPLEFLNMKAHYRVLHGTDPLGVITLRRDHVRLQVERELRSKLLLFRRGYLEGEGAPRRLQSLVERGLPSLLAIFRGMLFLKGGPWDATGPGLWEACSTHLGLPADLLPRLDDVRGKKSAPARDEIRAQVVRIMDGLRTLALDVDRWT